MKAMIEVSVGTKAEANAIRKAMSDPATKATVIVIGLLLPLTLDERQNVLGEVQDRLAK